MPDIYENNNTVQQSYTLPISFSGNTAIRNTTGSDAHTGTDYDFYKIELPAGFDYSITARLHDSYNSGNGNQYTLDGQFSYSFDGNTWSDAFDDIIPGNIQVQNGGAVYFFATPYFLGQTGTYLLDMNITRSALTATKDETIADQISVYPNPASTIIMVDLQHASNNFNEIEMVNMLGQVIQRTKIEGQQVARINVENVIPGKYNLQLRSVDSVLSKPVIVSR